MAGKLGYGKLAGELGYGKRNDSLKYTGAKPWERMNIWQTLERRSKRLH